MTTRSAYRVHWHPRTARRYSLRVVRPSTGNLATGVSRRWRQRIAPQSAADLAQAILANRRITLATIHESGVRDEATARQNVLDVAAGRPARRSSYHNAPGGYTSLDLRLLRALLHLGSVSSVTVSEIAGGSHVVGSAHYAGRALDVNIVNGRAVAAGADYGSVVRSCQMMGASSIFDPAYDPFGGHADHVHCQWGP
jgi:hypothetical protein